MSSLFEQSPTNFGVLGGNTTIWAAADVTASVRSTPSLVLTLTEDVNFAAIIWVPWQSGVIYGPGSIISYPGPTSDNVFWRATATAHFFPPPDPVWERAFMGDSGLTFEVWFSYRAMSGDTMFSVQAFAASGVNYHPEVTIWLWDGINAMPNPLVDTPYFDRFASEFQTLSVPVTPGITYYIRVAAAASSVLPFDGPLQLRFSASPRIFGDIGDFLVPSDVPDFPAALLSSTDGTVKQLREVVAGEEGAMLSSGIFAMLNDDEDVDTFNVFIYAADTTLLATVFPFPAVGFGRSLASDSAHTFYIGLTDVATWVTTVHTISDDGVVGARTWTIPRHGTDQDIRVIAPNRADTILYYATHTIGDPVGRWDLVNDVALSDLAPGIPNYRAGVEIFVLENGNILVGYTQTNRSLQFFNIYSPAGAIVATNTFTVPTAAFDAVRLATSPDGDPTFWAWTSGTDGSGNSISVYTQYSTADGSLLRTITVPMSANGILNNTSGPSDPTSVPFFSNSISCPFFVTKTPIPPPPPEHGEEIITPPTLPGCCDTPGVPTDKTPTTTPKPTPGCNPGGIGHKPQYTFVSGTVPIGADPPEGETFTGKRSMVLWVELHHSTFSGGVA